MRVTEKNIERDILEYLNTHGGFALKLNSGGKPILTNGQIIMIPFANKFSPKGLPDILYLFSGIALFIEVKRPSELKFITSNFSRLLEGDFNKDNKNYIRYHNQILFLERVKAAGSYGIFASSVQDVATYLGDLKNG